MEAHWIWWLAAVALVIAEMFSGTFYRHRRDGRHRDAGNQKNLTDE